MKLTDVFAKLDIERQRQGFSVMQISARAGISYPTYYHLIEGITNPTVMTLSQIMDALGVEVKLVRSTTHEPGYKPSGM